MNLRTKIDELLASHADQEAYDRLGELWRSEPGSATAAFVVSRCENLRGRINFVPYRLAILRSFTVEPVVPVLRACAFTSGIDLTMQIGDFNAYPQAILDDQSSLYGFSPDGVILAVRTADVAPELWERYADLDAGQGEAVSARVVSSFEQWIRVFRQHSSAAMIVHSLEQPIRPAFGVLDAQTAASQTQTIEQINREVARIVRGQRGVYVLDYDGLIARHGRLRWQDERKWLVARMPISAEHVLSMAREWMRFLVPLTGKLVKALVVDLDNTLWGGVIGEDGMTGIKLGAEYPGAAYQALQRAMLDLTKRGILLAICSKNNPDDAMEVLEHHSGMLLRPQQFAAMRINWQDKAQNLREIAAELNIGLDALAFLDDNPVERGQMRRFLPEVAVIDLPKDPLEYAAVVREWPGFERLTLSEEDRQRTELYAVERERSQAAQSFQSKEEFFRFLEQKAEIAPLLPETLARIAQLTQKTNQFNLTTRRYTEPQIKEMAAQPGCQVLSIRVQDRFGDHGLVGVAITRDDGAVCEIDTFLLSCRVIGRSVETGLLSYLAETAKARGQKQLAGWFLPTKKNAPARDFYLNHGFQMQEQNDRGTLWTFDLANQQIPCPDWVQLNVVQGESR